MNAIDSIIGPKLPETSKAGTEQPDSNSKDGDPSNSFQTHVLELKSKHKSRGDGMASPKSAELDESTDLASGKQSSNRIEVDLQSELTDHSELTLNEPLTVQNSIKTTESSLDSKIVIGRYVLPNQLIEGSTDPIAAPSELPDELVMGQTTPKFERSGDVGQTQPIVDAVPTLHPSRNGGVNTNSENVVSIDDSDAAMTLVRETKIDAINPVQKGVIEHNMPVALTVPKSDREKISPQLNGIKPDSDDKYAGRELLGGTRQIREHGMVAQAPTQDDLSASTPGRASSDNVVIQQQNFSGQTGSVQLPPIGAEVNQNIGSELNVSDLELIRATDGTISKDRLFQTVTSAQNSIQSNAAGARQIMAQITAGLNQLSDGTVEIRLNPAELGRITIQYVESISGGQTASVIAEKPEVLELLRRNENLLGAEFEQAGLEFTSFQFKQQNDQQTEDFPDAEPSENHMQTPIIDNVAVRAETLSRTDLDIRL